MLLFCFQPTLALIIDTDGIVPVSVTVGITRTVIGIPVQHASVSVKKGTSTSPTVKQVCMCMS